MQNGLTIKERNMRLLFGVLGFGIPLFFLIAQVLLGIGNMPLMLVMMSWFGISLFMFLGTSES